MVFEPKKFNAVFEEMRSRTQAVTDFEVGSVVRTMYESFAYEVALLYEKMQLVYLSAYVDTAEGQQLDQVVSVLGIKRGLPDFAEGLVTFERDVGNEDIEIPLGTLIATEDTPENPKKVYQTFEPKTLPKDQTSVDVKVRSVERGEDQVTLAETIVVMPRPILGIKSVINLETIQFVGKRRETDEELRERAKNALISSGKATIISVENALLGLPGVKDVKVKENFHFARGTVIFKRDSGSGDITIPKATRLTAAVEGTDRSFETTEQVVLPDVESSVEVTIQSLLEGQLGEVVETTGVTWRIDGPGLDSLSVSNDNPILLGDFGIIEVFVDGPDFSEPSEVERVHEEIDRVRAAGIFILLKSTIRVDVDGIFKIDIIPALNLSAEEKAEFEETVKTGITDFLSELKMGQPFLFSKLIKDIFSIDGIENFEDFRIITNKMQDDSLKENTFDFSDKRVDIEEFERFNARYICVASEEKLLTVNIQFKADGLDDGKRDQILNELGKYFDGLALGHAVSSNEIESRISSVSGTTLVPDTLKVVAESWCPRPLLKEQAGSEIVDVSFVEQAVLGDVFAYHSFLEIIGALKLTLPLTLTDAEKQTIRSEILTKIETYLNTLKAEEDVVFDDLVSIASGVDRVLAVDLANEDFRVEINGAEAPERVTADKIEIAQFEKAKLKEATIGGTQFTFFCIAADVEKVEISVTVLELTVLGDVPPPTQLRNALKEAVRNTINNFLSAAVAGEDVVYQNLKSAIEGLITGVSYQVTQLSLQAEALCDSRKQTADFANAKNIHIRSVELPVMISIATTDVSLILPPDEES